MQGLHGNGCLACHALLERFALLLFQAVPVLLVDDSPFGGGGGWVLCVSLRLLPVVMLLDIVLAESAAGVEGLVAFQTGVLRGTALLHLV